DARRRAASSSTAAGRSPLRSTIRNGICWPSPSTARMAARPLIGGYVSCPSPTTRSSTPGIPWAWRRLAARMWRGANHSGRERRALALLRCRGGREHPGAALNGGALFAIPLVAASSHPLAPAALGAAEGALELFLETMAKRSGTYTGARVADFQAVQIKVARARCLIDSARDLLRQS